MTDVDDYDPAEEAEARARAEEPPDWYLEQAAAGEMLRHRLDVHDGAVCNCPAPEPPAADPWATEPPFQEN